MKALTHYSVCLIHKKGPKKEYTFSYFFTLGKLTRLERRGMRFQALHKLFTSAVKSKTLGDQKEPENVTQRLFVLTNSNPVIPEEGKGSREEGRVGE